MSRRRAVIWAALAVAVALIVVLVLVLGGRSAHRRQAGRPVVAPSATGPPAQPPPSGELFGISVNRLFNDLVYSRAQINAQLSALQGTGATAARSDALWEAAEPNPPVAGVHHYDWTFADAVAGSLAAHGIRWFPIIDYTAPWAQSVKGQDHSPPRDDADYAAYAAAFAARYGDGGTFWRRHPELRAQPVETYEIWNEPDGPSFWFPSPSPDGYAKLYLRARAAITAVQPGARVIIGGLTKPNIFLPAMLTAAPELRGHVDGVGIHPYRPTPAGVVAAVREDRALLNGLGMPMVPLYVTEFGWTARPKGARDWLPERLRPVYIGATLAGLAHVDCGVAGVFLYTWLTPQHNRLDGEDWFGIHPPRGGDTAETKAFTAALALARAALAGAREPC